MGEVHTEEGPKADILVLIEGRARYLAHLGHVKTPEILRGCAAEITRLRAALADAHAAGFAAGVEAAAKVAAMQAVHTREVIKRATASELVSNLVTVTKSRTAHDTEIAIRAIAPPDATAAAARVLLADEAAMNTLSDYEHRQWAGWFKHQLEQSTPENIERWKRQADMPFTLLSDDEKAADRRFADAALRAIAGDTP